MKNKTGTVHNDRWILILFCVLVFVLYGNSLRNGYSLDDDFVIENNSSVQKGITGIPAFFLTPYAKELRQSYGYRPVTLATFAIEYQIFGLKPAVSHLINILLYLLTCMVLFRFADALFSQYSRWLSFLTVFFFLIHPLHSEVVNNIKNRDEILAFLFSIICSISILKYYDTGMARFLIYGLLIYMAAFLSKVSALPFIAAIPVTLFFFKPVNRKRMSITIAALIFLPVMVFLLKRMVVPGEDPRIFFYFENPMFFSGSIHDRVPAALITLGYYIRLLIFPHPLSFYYGYDYVSLSGYSNPYLWGGAISVLLFILLIVKGFAKKTFPAYSVIILILLLAPFLNLATPVAGIIGERLAYGASFPFSCLLAYFLLKIFRMLPRHSTAVTPLMPGFWGVMAVLFTACAVKIITRNMDWKDRITLYRHDIKHLARSAKAHSLLGDAALKAAIGTQGASMKQNLLAESEYHYKQALGILPDYPMVLNNLGSIYFMFRNDYKKSKEFFEHALRSDNASPEAHFNLGLSLKKLNDTAAALTQFREAVRLHPAYFDAHSQLGNTLMSMSDYESALVANSQASVQFPYASVFYRNSGICYRMLKDRFHAIAYFEKALELEKSKEEKRELCRILSEIYSESGDAEKSSYYLSRTVH